MHRGGIGVLIGLALAPMLALAAPAPDPVAVDAARSALTGRAEDIPILWGGDPMDYDPGAALDMAIGGREAPEIPPATPQPVAPPPTASSPEPTVQAQPTTVRLSASRAGVDQVSGLTVQGRRVSAAAQTVEKCVTGPAWWRVSNGKAVLWIMGTPDQMPMNTAWDDTCLKKRMQAARAIIIPAIPPSGVQDPFGRGNTKLRIVDTPLSQRLPAPLWTQLSRRMDDNLVRAQARADWARNSSVQQMSPDTYRRSGGDRTSIRTTTQVMLDAPNLFAPPIVVASRMALNLNLGANLGNPAAERTAALAGQGGMLIGRTKNSEAEFATFVNMANPSEADQTACLKKVLDELDAGHSGLGLLPSVQAWASGDYKNGLQRMNVLNTCPLGDLGVRFWSALVAQYMQLIERNMAQGRITVAVIEYDPMFIKGGVMERLKQRGYTITPPEDLQ